MHDPRAFGLSIKTLRRARDLTQEALAREVGCAPVTIKKIEAGALRPSRQIAERLADALGVTDRAAFVEQARGVGSPSEQSEPGEAQVRGYLLRERLGAGGFGVVYRAVQPAVRRDVAIKVIAPEHANQPEFIRRFEAEAQTVARLEHPHIVPLYDFWRDAGGAFLVMRWMRGGALSAALNRGPWALAAATRLVDQIGAALTTAHRQGVIHRDVKPANVLLDEDGNAYLADFGIAKQQHAHLDPRQTQAGLLVGSPEYLAPEQISGEPVTPQTDIYSFGILIYELLAGVHPLADVPPAERLSWKLTRDLPPLRSRRPELPAELDTALRRAAARDPRSRYADVPALVRDLQQIVAARHPPSITPPLVATPPRPHTDGDATLTALAAAPPNPYRGLHAFQEADAPTFFGREALTGRLIQRMDAGETDARALVVVGPSGGGKSSVVRAGLIPALRRGAIPGSERWFITACLPGSDPLEEIEAALLRVAVNPPDSLLGQLREDDRGLLRAVKRVLPDDPGVELVLVIDQFEELFTLVEREDERAHLLRSLLVAVQDERARLRLIVTLRADFFDRPLRYEGWDTLLQRRTEVVTLLTPEEIGRAIIGPAERVGLTAEPGLVEAIVRHVREQPGALPLLQYALTELFDRRDGRLLTIGAYEAIGGVAGALARRAEALYAQLSAGEQAAARQLFLRLVAVGDADDTRRRVPLDELPRAAPSGPRRQRGGAGEAVLERYGAYRLLTFDRDPVTREATVEVAHEALLRSWGRLREWLDESRANLRLHRRLMAAAAEWRENGQAAGYLAAGARLVQFEALLGDGGVVLNAAEEAFVRASVAERERAEARERDRQAELRETLARTEALRLAAEARRLAQADGSSETVALLAIRSLRTRYTPQGDEALTLAAARELPTKRLSGHDGPLWGIDVAPDGRWCVTASQDQTARIWDLATGAELRRLTGHTDVVYCAAASPDGRLVLTGSYDATARLWDAVTGETVAVLSGHTDIITRAVFAGDGRTVATSSLDRTAIVWDVASGERRCTLAGHTNAVWGVALSRDGGLAMTASWDGTARLWDASTGASLHELRGHESMLWSVAVAPDGRTAVSCGSTAIVWDVASGRELRRLVGHGNVINAVVFSPDSRLLLTGAQDRTARLWDVASGRELRRFVGHSSFVWDVAFAPGGRQVVTASYDATALVWDIEPGGELPAYRGHAGLIEGIAIAPDGRRALTASVDGTARIWDVASAACERTLTGHTAAVSGCAWSPDGQTVITASRDQTARVWDAASGALMRVLAGHTRGVVTVAIAEDSRTAITGGEDYAARVWDLATGQELRTLNHGGEVFDLACAHRARLALVGAADGAAVLWDIDAGEERMRLSHANGASAVAIAPDDRLAATGGWDGSIWIWDFTTGEPLWQLSGHSDVVWRLAFAPGGGLLSGSGDGTVRLWDVEARQERRRFGGQAQSGGVAVHPDGESIFVAFADGSVQRWPVDVRAGIGALCRRLRRDLSPAERRQYTIGDDAPTCGPGDANAES